MVQLSNCSSEIGASDILLCFLGLLQIKYVQCELEQISKMGITYWEELPMVDPEGLVFLAV